MTEPAVRLLRTPALREVACLDAPASVMASLREAVQLSRQGNMPLVGKFTERTFSLTEPFRWSGYRFPGKLRGAVASVGAGSRVCFRADIGHAARLVLRAWAAVSIVLLALCVGFVSLSLKWGEPSRVIQSLWPAGLVLVVWWSWRRIAERGVALEAWLARQLRQPGSVGGAAAEDGGGYPELRVSDGRSGSTFFFSFEVHPGPAARSHHPGVGGAFVNCWVKAPSVEEARGIAVGEIEESGWAILVPAREELLDALDVASGLGYYRQAQVDGVVCVFHTYPEGEANA